MARNRSNEATADDIVRLRENIKALRGTKDPRKRKLLNQYRTALKKLLASVNKRGPKGAVSDRKRRVKKALPGKRKEYTPPPVPDEAKTSSKAMVKSGPKSAAERKAEYRRGRSSKAMTRSQKTPVKAGSRALVKTGKKAMTRTGSRALVKKDKATMTHFETAHKNPNLNPKRLTYKPKTKIKGKLGAMAALAGASGAALFALRDKDKKTKPGTVKGNEATRKQRERLARQEGKGTPSTGKAKHQSVIHPDRLAERKKVTDKTVPAKKVVTKTAPKKDKPVVTAKEATVAKPKKLSPSIRRRILKADTGGDIQGREVAIAAAATALAGQVPGLNKTANDIAGFLGKNLKPLGLAGLAAGTVWLIAKELASHRKGKASPTATGIRKGMAFLKGNNKRRKATYR